jgi:hypothetical protein
MGIIASYVDLTSGVASTSSDTGTERRLILWTPYLGNVETLQRDDYNVNMNPTDVSGVSRE